MRLEAAQREFQAIKAVAMTPRPVLLGCDRTAHKNMEFCSACTNSWSLEVNGWRLLAMIREEESNV